MYNNPLYYRNQRPVQINRRSPQAEGLVVWWPFLDRRLTDRIGDQVLSPVNGPVFATSDQGLAVNFESSSSQYLTTETLIDSYPFSLSAWIKLEQLPTIAGDEMTVIAIQEVGDNNNFLNIRVDDVADQVQFAIRQGGGATQTATTTIAVSAGVWHHVIGVAHSATDRRVFLDGGGRGTNTVSVTLPATLDGSTIGALEIGTTQNFIDGLIRDVRIYRALSDAEVYRLWSPATRWDLFRLPQRSWVLSPTVTAGGILTPNRGFWGVP